MLSHAALTPPAVLAPKRRPDHARDTKVGFVVLPLLDELIDNSLLLGDTVQLGNKTRIINHGAHVEEGGHGEEYGKQEIPKIGPICEGWSVRYRASINRMRMPNIPSLKAVPGNNLKSQFKPTRESDAAKMPAIQGCEHSFSISSHVVGN